MGDSPESKTITLPTALITGCSDGGIGSSLAKAFQARGVHVFATARKLSKMTGLEGLPNMTRLELDVESPSSVVAAKETVIAATSGDGRLNYLVNNSGVNLNFPAVETDIKDAKKVFDVNFWGVVSVNNTFLPLLIASNGTIINNASVSAAMYAPWSCKTFPRSSCALSWKGSDWTVCVFVECSILRCLQGGTTHV